MNSPNSLSNSEQPRQTLTFDQARQVLYTAGDIALENGEHRSDLLRAQMSDHLGKMLGTVDTAEADSTQIMGAFPEGEVPTITIDRILSRPRARKEEIFREQTIGYETPINPFLVNDDEHLALTALELYVLAAHREIK